MQGKKERKRKENDREESLETRHEKRVLGGKQTPLLGCMKIINSIIIIRITDIFALTRALERYRALPLRIGRE